MNNGTRAHLLHNKVHSTFLRGELYCGKEPGGPFRNCVAENKEKGSGRRGEGEERGEAARGEVSLALVAAGEVGVFCCRREGEMEWFHGFAVSWPFRTFPHLGQGLGQRDFSAFRIN